jgi:cystathionine beta-synthase
MNIKIHTKAIFKMTKSTLLNAIGNTPLVAVNTKHKAQIFAKLEYLNPGGSVKDRSALFMIEHAERNGLLKPGGTIIDASSGNHGIAVAMIGRIKGYKVIITVSEKVSKEKLQTIIAYGAQVIMCPATEFIDDPQSYHHQALALHKQTPGSFMPNQYYNIINAQAHEALLGPEIWSQTEGKVTHFFAGAGTGGTISGVGKFLKSKNPNIKVIAIDSDQSFRSTNGHPKPYVVEGMGIDFETPVLNKNVIDEIIPVSDVNAIQTLKDLSLEQGLLVGPSSGAVAHAAITYASKLKKDDLAVIIFGDSGRAYLSKGFYNQSDVINNIQHSPKINIKEKTLI